MIATTLRLYQSADDFGLTPLTDDHPIRQTYHAQIAKALEAVKNVFGTDASVVYIPRVAASPIREMVRDVGGLPKFNYYPQESWGLEWGGDGLGLRYLYSAVRIDALEPKSDATSQTPRFTVPSYIVASHRAFTFTNTDPVQYSGSPSPLLSMHTEPLGCPPELFIRGMPMKLPERREDREALILTGKMPF